MSNLGLSDGVGNDDSNGHDDGQGDCGAPKPFCDDLTTLNSQEAFSLETACTIGMMVMVVMMMG
jgi:hypothetical protein